MGYSFVVGKDQGYRPKENGRYPWPALKCVPPEPDRTIYLDITDVVTPYIDKDDGQEKWMVQTGLGCFGILLTRDQVVPLEKDVHLRIG